MMKLDSLEKLYIHELKDLYSAEKQIMKALPKMKKAASEDELKQAFEEHLGQTETHIARLDKIYEELPAKPGGEKCKGAEGLIEEGEELIKAEADERVRDAALIAAAQRVEHYEMAGYGSAVALAKRLGKHGQAEVLQSTLEEEGLTDRKLTQIAEKSINLEAAKA